MRMLMAKTIFSLSGPQDATAELGQPRWDGAGPVALSKSLGPNTAKKFALILAEMTPAHITWLCLWCHAACGDAPEVWRQVRLLLSSSLNYSVSYMPSLLTQAFFCHPDLCEVVSVPEGSPVAHQGVTPNWS